MFILNLNIMKTAIYLSISLVTVLILGSCSSSNEVVGGGILQKRKYTSGVYWDKTEKVKSSKETKEEYDIFRIEEESQKKYVSSSTIQNEDEIRDEAPESSVNASDEIIESEKSVVTVPSTNNEGNNNSANEDEEQPVIKNKKSLIINNRDQKKDSNQNRPNDSMFILAVIFAILIPPLGVLIYTNIDWMKVLICLLLTVLFFIPGMIYALLVVFDVI